MGAAELLAALRSEGEKKAGLIREEAAGEAARLRAEAEALLARMREASLREQTQAIAAATGAIIAEAERDARQLGLSALQQLAERLHGLARQFLPRLRTDEYPGAFARLAAEIPPALWEEIRVNPADVDRAALLFPGAKVVADAGICGGLIALADGGREEVVNTLEKRLERGWPELLPALLAEVETSA